MAEPAPHLCERFGVVLPTPPPPHRAGVDVAGMELSGVVSSQNGTHGFHLYGGSAIKVRGSYLSKNGVHGIMVETHPGFIAGGAGANSGNQLTRLDVGTAADYGHNVIQDAANPNTLRAPASRSPAAAAPAGC